MIALFVAVAAVAVERFINKRRMRLPEVLADVGWLTLLFAAIEFAYLFVVEALTLNFGAAVRPLWHTEWPVFKILLLEVSVGVLLILTSVWIESAGVRIELRRPHLQLTRVASATSDRPRRTRGSFPQKRCDVEWREAT